MQNAACRYSSDGSKSYGSNRPSSAHSHTTKKIKPYHPEYRISMPRLNEYDDAALHEYEDDAAADDAGDEPLLPSELYRRHSTAHRQNHGMLKRPPEPM